jgi:hypothetical protein
MERGLGFGEDRLERAVDPVGPGPFHVVEEDRDLGEVVVEDAASAPGSGAVGPSSSSLSVIHPSVLRSRMIRRWGQRVRWPRELRSSAGRYFE